MIFEAIEKFGGDGYMVFFGTLEILSDEFDVFNPGVARISIKKLTKSYLISRQKLVKILSFFDQKSKEKLTESKSFSVTFEKEYVVINCPRLKDLCDEFTQKLLTKNRESIGSQSGVTPVASRARASLEAEGDSLESFPKGKDFILPSFDEILLASGPKLKGEINEIAGHLYHEKVFPEVFSFVNKSLKDKMNPRAIVHVLTRCYARKPAEPFGYCTKILKTENGNFNARDNERY